MLRRGRTANGARRRLNAETSRTPGFEYYGRTQTSLPAAPRTSPDRRTARQQSWFSRLGAIVLAIALLASLFSALSLSPHAKVLPLTAGANNLYLHDQTSYQTAADQLLADSIWNRNKLTINTSRINAKLQAQFPELTSVNVVLPLLAHRPNIYIESAKPAALLRSGSDTYLIDDTGRALIKGADVDRFRSLQLPTLTDQSGLRVQLGHQVITRQNVSFILTVMSQLTAKHATVTELSLPPGSSELDVRVADRPYFGKFNLQSDTAKLQAGTYLATVAQLQRDHIVPTQYIDVRVPGRAYYL